MDRIPLARFFNDPCFQKVREQWCAALFGIGYSKYVAQCKVAVNESGHRMDVDFLLQAGGWNWEFQLAEVQRPGRRRGDEYKRLANRADRFVQFVGDPTAQEGSKWLATGAERKRVKKYSASRTLNLLLYANFPALGLEYESVRTALVQYAKDFNSVWVLTSMHLCSAFSQPGLGEIQSWAEIRAMEVYYPY